MSSSSAAPLHDEIYVLGHPWGTNEERGNAETRSATEADDGARTRDTWLGKPVLYQLSYVRQPDRF
jgi:hypothetical protein